MTVGLVKDFTFSKSNKAAGRTKTRYADGGAVNPPQLFVSRPAPAAASPTPAPAANPAPQLNRRQLRKQMHTEMRAAPDRQARQSVQQTYRPKIQAAPRFAEGGKVYSDADMDKKAVKTAVYKHEKAKHKGEPLTKLAKGGKAPMSRVEAMDKREMAATPTMRRESAMASRKVEAPARRSVPVASREPILAMRNGGKAAKC